MQTKPRIPLWMRFLLLGVLNLAILAIVFAVFMRMQLKPELESFLMAQAREKIASVTALISSDLRSTDFAQWDSVLGHYSKQYGIRFLLYRNTGEQLAGIPTPLPPEVDARMPRGGPPPPRDAIAPPRPGINPSQQLPPGPPFLAATNSDANYWIGVRMPIMEGPDHSSAGTVVPPDWKSSSTCLRGRLLVRKRKLSDLPGRAESLR